MILSDVVNEILLRAGEGYDEYADRAKNHFIYAISQLLKTDNYDQSDIHQCIETVLFRITDPLEFILIQNDIHKILDFNLSNFAKSHILNQVTYDKLKLLSCSEIGDDEIYLAFRGRTIFSFKKLIETVSIDVRYIFIPSFDFWQNNQDISGFSNRFLYDCIELAKNNLLKEITD
ncbi:MAG TPA: hypothetical protein PK816_09810 [Candidatus Cloacimonadota bacterium]|nr:hypothetical protein [Candidatus Cloacimonadota bacterium]